MSLLPTIFFLKSTQCSPQIDTYQQSKVSVSLGKQEKLDMQAMSSLKAEAGYGGLCIIDLGKFQFFVMNILCINTVIMSAFAKCTKAVKLFYNSSAALSTFILNGSNFFMLLN